MTHTDIRTEGRAGRITLNRPQALNAMNDAMLAAVDTALSDWAHDPAVDLVLIDAAGDRAFCAGGDIAEIYAAGCAGDFARGRDFWRREYRMNARIAEYPKPVVTLMQGFTMGGGVGLGCHASHRVVGDSSRIAMPECGIGLVPDVGGSYLLANAPGRLGEYLGLTGAHMVAGDAIDAGFADWYLPEARWAPLVTALCATGDPQAVEDAALPAPPHLICNAANEVEAHFAGETLGDIWRSLKGSDTPFATKARDALARVSPLAAAAHVEILHRLGDNSTLRKALELEFRFTFRAQGDSDFLEGIRAAVIDKDRRPKWRHAGPEAVPTADVARMLMPLGADKLTWENAA